MATYKINNRPARIDYEVTGLIDRTLQNAKNLLMTHMGEVPYDRYRGFDPALYDLPLTRLREELIEEADRIMLWEPDVEVVDADCYLDETNSVVIEITIEIDIEE